MRTDSMPSNEERAKEDLGMLIGMSIFLGGAVLSTYIACSKFLYTTGANYTSENEKKISFYCSDAPVSDDLVGLHNVTMLLNHMCSVAYCNLFTRNVAGIEAGNPIFFNGSSVSVSCFKKTDKNTESDLGTFVFILCGISIVLFSSVVLKAGLNLYQNLDGLKELCAKNKENAAGEFGVRFLDTASGSDSGSDTDTAHTMVEEDDDEDENFVMPAGIPFGQGHL